VPTGLRPPARFGARLRGVRVGGAHESPLEGAIAAGPGAANWTERLSPSQEIPLQTLSDREPDFKSIVDTYNDSVSVMSYPHNFAHSVTPEANPRAAGETPSCCLDFVAPTLDCLVKGLVMSERSPVEH